MSAFESFALAFIVPTLTAYIVVWLEERKQR